MTKVTEAWKLSEVPAHFAAVAQLADEHGYVACLFGSTLKAGAGRDLDIMMLSRFREVQRYEEFLQKFGGTSVRTFKRPDRGNHSYEVERDGKLFHFVFGRF